VSSISPNPHVEPPRRLLLQYLDLTDCMAIDDMGLKIVVKNCPQLVYLYLRRCIQITGELELIILIYTARYITISYNPQMRV